METTVSVHLSGKRFEKQYFCALSAAGVQSTQNVK